MSDINATVSRHCARLTAPRGPSPADHARVGEVLERLAIALRSALDPLLGGAARVVAAPPRVVAAGTTVAGLAASGHHLALAFDGRGERALLTVAAEPLMRLVDRRFGGAGGECGASTRLPGSARLLADRLLAPVVDALDGGWGEGVATAATVVGREDDLARLRPIDPAADALHLVLAVVEAGWPGWSVALVLPLPLVTGWPDRSDRRAGAAASARPDPGSMARGRLGHVALPLRAVVDEPRLPLRRVGALAVGDCIPLGLGGTATLRLGDRTVAHGVVGATAGKVAIRVTSAQPRLALAAPLETQT